METKDVYTGKGWITSDRKERFRLRRILKFLLLSFTDENTIEKTVETSKVHQMKEYPHVLYPFGVKTIQSGIGNSY